MQLSGKWVCPTSSLQRSTTGFGAINHQNHLHHNLSIFGSIDSCICLLNTLKFYGDDLMGISINKFLGASARISFDRDYHPSIYYRNIIGKPLQTICKKKKKIIYQRIVTILHMLNTIVLKNTKPFSRRVLPSTS